MLALNFVVGGDCLFFFALARSCGLFSVDTGRTSYDSLHFRKNLIKGKWAQLGGEVHEAFLEICWVHSYEIFANNSRQQLLERLTPFMLKVCKDRTT